MASAYKPTVWKYGMHPSVAMVQKWLVEISTKTGKTLEEWMKIIGKIPDKESKARKLWLKEKYGLGTNIAGWLVDRSEGKNEWEDTPEEYLAAASKWVDEMFAGSKVALRPIYDRILEVGHSLGKDVKVCPCRTIIPLYHNHVFAQVKPSTRTRIDLGFSLKGVPKLPSRMLDTGGIEKGNRITHRIELTSLDEIDTEVIKWLKTAYDLDSK